MRDMGFRWRKTKNNRKILMEKPYIQALRRSFLRNIKHYREENRPIIYMDETYIHSSHTHAKNWGDNTIEGFHKPVSKGPRLIIVHAGGEMGFINNACLQFKSGTKSGDYHSEMNYNRTLPVASSNVFEFTLMVECLRVESPVVAFCGGESSSCIPELYIMVRVLGLTRKSNSSNRDSNEKRLTFDERKHVQYDESTIHTYCVVLRYAFTTLYHKKEEKAELISCQGNNICVQFLGHPVQSNPLRNQNQTRSKAKNNVIETVKSEGESKLQADSSVPVMDLTNSGYSDERDKNDDI
ncbi:unnamed protein product [Acanthoscelides obtectus]|uniref:Uncharacterized protein n=1 Tax=Acanthoscelides obtectus TaxID=200917 RepID=A0A9P0LSZ5_ACAOB|nr:unnamed protein product [Acanthoscelides obtectus]CAK1683239.1 hypothetical protein AOBTE_LOCUS34156 [Acanthoscelides obtectus]